MSTQLTDALCKEISAQCGGVCLLEFSRGKDSIVSWLQLRRFFPRLIPFHLASIPHLSFVDESLAYYEDFFQTKIERYLNGYVAWAISDLQYQSPESKSWAESCDYRLVKTREFHEALRRKHDVPLAYCARGLTVGDNLGRRIHLRRYKGRNDKAKVFYPIYDWSKELVLKTVKRSGVKLPKDYWLHSHSLTGMPDYMHLERMRRLFPQDYERTKALFPLIDVSSVRMQFRRERIARTQNARGPVNLNHAKN